MNNRDIVGRISDFLSNSDILNLSLVCKDYTRYLRQKIKNRKYKHIQSIFPEWIVEMVGKDRFVSMPYLKWNPEWSGSTSYIDRIPYGQSSSSMWYTEDTYKRQALVIDIEATVYHNQEIKVKQGCIAIFRRYTDGIGFTHGTCYGQPFALLCPGGMIHENNDILILPLIKKGEVVFDNKEKYWWIDKKIDKVVFRIK